MMQIKSLALGVLLVASVGGNAQSAATKPAAERPRITSISHVAYFVSNLDAAISFWHNLLGYDVYGTLPREDGSTRITFVKINDHQHIELFTDAPVQDGNHFSHICFAVDDIQRMRNYLREQGFDVKDSNGKTRMGDYAFMVHDPDGTLIEFVQTLPDGREGQAAGRFLPETRIANRIYHAGFLVRNTQKELDFYEKVLGFTETWRGAAAGSAVLSWINLKVPDGDDYIELMLMNDASKPGYGTKNHVSLAVADIDKALKELQLRAEAQQYTRPLTINTGVNRKRQVNLYDADGTRVELMEPFTVDGGAAAASTLPAPPPVKE